MSVDFSSNLGERGAEMNLNNANGAALLDAMGFLGGNAYLVGECTIAEARRGVIRARNRNSLEQWRRPAVNERRCFSPAFTEEELVERIDRFSQLVESNADRGATVIRWG